MIDGLILSFQLFSRISLKKEIDFNQGKLRKALEFLPLVGLVIGFVVGLVVYIFMRFSNILAAGLGTVTYIALTGAFHLDGLADMADGFLANADKDRTLEIMQDPTIGSMGTLALISYSLLKFSLYAAISIQNLYIILISSFLSRLATMFLIQRGKPARPGGFGDTMKQSMEGSKAPYLWLAVGVLASLIFKPQVLLALISSLILIGFLKLRVEEKIGGLTGDIYGAAIEIAEVFNLLILYLIIAIR